MNVWDALDTVGLACFFVWLACFWYTASRTVLDLNYPKNLRVGAYLHLAKGAFAFAVPLVLLLVIQHPVTGSP
jgi:hypothetical protein